MLFFVAICYVAYLCARPWLISRGPPDVLDEVTYGTHGNDVRPPPRAMDFSGVLRGQATTTEGNESRCLTMAEASKVVAATTVAAADVTLPLEAMCVVCLDDINVGTRDRNVVVLPCAHAFHPLCISQWLTKGNTLCPCCNFDVAKIARGESGCSTRRPPLSEGPSMVPSTLSQHTALDSHDAPPIGLFSTADSARHAGGGTGGAIDGAVPAPAAQSVPGPGGASAGGDGEIHRVIYGLVAPRLAEERPVDGAARNLDTQPLRGQQRTET
jgi:Ring finger domain